MKIYSIPALIVSIALLGLSACGGGGGGGTPSVPPGTGGDGSSALGTLSRYSMANRCWALKAASNNMYLATSGTGYAATAAAVGDAEGFYLKPSALGDYLLHNESGQLLSAGASTVGNQSLASASNSAVFVIKGVADATEYPVAPLFDVEPTAEQIAAYRGFTDPDFRASLFTLAAKPDGRHLTVSGTGALTVAAAADSSTQHFAFEALEPAGCKAFSEAQNNAVGETFNGTTSDGRVLGMADTHVHVTSTTFLGGAKSGAPFHTFGVTHAVGDCAETHGEGGSKDGVGAAFIGDTDGHDTTGWPTFPEWPARGALTHESIYWKWLERGWLSGLRILVNDVVDNGTLCELQRNASGTTGERCNEMETAREQVGTTYAMQDYIDAQYGGRGKGWFRIVLDPAEARRVVADGKLAVVIGIEISNLFNCQLTYKPTRTKQPFEETGSGPNENSYQCATTETGAPNEIGTQLDQLVALGVRQIISIHEFDSAFGGNGIFDGEILNLGNRENSGGNPTPGFPPNDPFAFNPPNETPTGEFWTTYDCATEEALATATPGDGYLWGDSAGAIMTNFGPPPPLCRYAGQGGRHGGTTACYPSAPQCNSRWMTPAGLYMYKKLMEYGIIIDFDHMTIDMKTQALELAEAQNPPYPFVSTHGTFGGTTLEQTRRVLVNGGHLYPSLGNGPSLLADMKEVRDVWEAAGVPYLFGFGFGTDTNGLSGQAAPRSAERVAADPVVYPFTLFKGPLFNLMPEFAALDNDNNASTPYTGVVFNQPEEFAVDGASARKWHIDVDGSAHYGMLSELVEEVRLEAVAAARPNALAAANTQQMRDLFNAAEVYIQTWERTVAAQRGILNNDNGGKTKEPVTPILRAAP